MYFRVAVSFCGIVAQGHLIFVDHLNEMNYFTFPKCTSLKCLLCACCFNILDSRVEICVTAEFRSVINLWLDDYGDSPNHKS